MVAVALSLQRLAAGLASRHAAAALPCAPVRGVASLRCTVTPHAGRSSTALTQGWRPQQQQPAAERWRQHGQCLPPAASYSVVTDGGSGSGDGGRRQPWKLIIYSKEGCHLCDGLKEKVEALLDRAAFLPSALSTAELEVRDITSNPQWEAAYAMTIPVLAAADADGSNEVEVPRPSPRFSADALQKHIEKFLAAQEAQQQQQQQQ